MSTAPTSPTPSDASLDPLVDGSPASLRSSRALCVIAALALLANCFLNSPGAFSQRHHDDNSFLKSVVSALALGGHFPTPRGVEIRNLIFYFGAALLLAIAALRLATSNIRPRLSGDDLLDYRRRCSSPYFWWILLLIAASLSSIFSHAPEFTYGQLIIRCMTLAWWWPLAALLTARDARKLLVALLLILLATSALALWYNLQRPAERLSYPLGNELFLAACLLPAVFLAIAFTWPFTHSLPFVAPGVSQTPASARFSLPRLILAAFALAPILYAIYLTKSRSAIAGLAAGFAALIFYSLGRRLRWFALLSVILIAFFGSLWIEQLRVGGIMGQRAHSIRARLNHEWPYAIALFLQKPVLGHGEGAYSLLAGQYARDDQLDDPNTISFDEWSWIRNAHNEFLELLADIGLVGASAFAAALFIPLWRALRFCDRLRGDSSRQSTRLLVISLAAALVALVIEESADVALRMPGLPPIFLTVWAALWALVRTEHVPAATPVDAHRLSAAAPRLIGLTALASAVVLAYFAIQDWRASRTQWSADRAAQTGRFADALSDNNFAASHLLDPFRRCTAHLGLIAARTALFHNQIADDPAPPSDDLMRSAEQTYVLLARLNLIAPRFLQSARIESELLLDMAQSCNRRGEPQYERDFLARHLDARRRHRADEPFRMDAVQALWLSDPDARTIERIEWLRCLLRRGEIPDGFDNLAVQLAQSPDLNPVLSELLNIARADRAKNSVRWQDRLAPESLRLAAYFLARSNQFSDAAKLALEADALYKRAGPRLFAARAAALHESVRYDFHADPVSQTDTLLARLHRAAEIMAGPTPRDAALHSPLGRTRLMILLAAQDEPLARAQIAALKPARSSTDARPALADNADLAAAYRVLISEFDRDPTRSELITRWKSTLDYLEPAADP